MKAPLVYKVSLQGRKLFENVQAFLNFRGFYFLDFQFKSVYNSILFPSPLVLQGVPAFRDFTIRDPRYFGILFKASIS